MFRCFRRDSVPRRRGPNYDVLSSFESIAPMHGELVLAVFRHGVGDEAVVGPSNLFVAFALECPLFLDVAGAGHAAANAGHSLDEVLGEFPGLQKHERLAAFGRAVALPHVQAGRAAVLYVRLFHGLRHAAGIGVALGMDAAVLRLLLGDGLELDVFGAEHGAEFFKG